MMSWTKDDVAAQVEWEGGVTDLIEWGFKFSDLPDDTPSEVRAAWWRLAAALEGLPVIINWLLID